VAIPLTSIKLASAAIAEDRSTLRPQPTSAGGKAPRDLPEQADLMQSCVACVAGQFKLCAGLRKKTDDPAEPPTDMPAPEYASARRTICGRREWPDFVHVICSGWAMTSITHTDGRRQILSFLLPGDSESTLNIFQPRFGRAIEAITGVLYRRFKREDVKEKLLARPDLIETLGQVWSEEKERADQLAIDLGRRTADERIARQLLELSTRLAKRGMANEGTMEFPLRQRHIADLTGLTPVHVSRVMSEFHRAGMIALEGRTLRILDIERLRRVAEYR
jgi:CRP/FNR family transcriptional regulator, anaerobic regulatory protein